LEIYGILHNKTGMRKIIFNIKLPIEEIGRIVYELYCLKRPQQPDGN
jgi:hypothetical protein